MSGSLDKLPPIAHIRLFRAIPGRAFLFIGRHAPAGTPHQGGQLRRRWLGTGASPDRAFLRGRLLMFSCQWRRGPAAAASAACANLLSEPDAQRTKSSPGAPPDRSRAVAGVEAFWPKRPQHAYRMRQLACRLPGVNCSTQVEKLIPGFRVVAGAGSMISNRTTGLWATGVQVHRLRGPYADAGMTMPH